MSKQPLTQKSINEFTNELYLKTDAAILLEANAVATDFATWLDNKFDLTLEEKAYIATYTNNVNQFYGHLFAAGFHSRSPITFAAPPDNPTPRRTKETRANLFGEVKFNDADKELTGTFEINISFDLL